MKKISKILSIILAILMIISVIPISSSAATYGGTCGDNVTWTYDSSTYTLTISGTGEMYDYEYNNRPWESYEDKIKTVVINDGVTTIGAFAIFSFGKVVNVTIPESISVIEKSAFEGCKNLTNITIPNSVTIINEWTFSECESLTNITLSDNITTIGDYAFNGCISLENITIPNSVTTIGERVFYFCDSLREVVIPDGVISIGEEAFSACENLTTVRIPASVTTIGEDAFLYCENLATIMVDSENQYYSTDENNSILFNKDKTSLILYLRNNPQTSYNIPDTVTTICNEAFTCCENLTSITIGKNVEVIGDNAFDLCSNLTSLVIPDSVKTIGNGAFFNCFNLESVKIGNGVTSIGNGAFTLNESYYPDKAMKLKELTLGNSVTIIGDSAFEDCTMLTSVTIPDSVTIIGFNAFADCSNLKDVKIGNGVTTIGPGAFYECRNITEIIIPNSVTTIGYQAFEYCSNLKSVLVPDSVTIIGSVAFAWCTRLTNISLPDSITTIERYTFKYCESLESIIIPNSITEIGEGAFYKCTGLKDVYFTGTEEQWNEIAIDSDNQPLLNATIHYNYHIHKYNSVVTDPTCTEQGYTTYTCECGDSYVDDYVDLLGHDIIIDEAIAPDCVNTGLTEGSHCSRCDDATAEQEIVPELGHSHNAVITPPTCTEQGYTTYTCECGDTYIDNYVDATGHSYGEWTVIKEATVDGEGEMERVCSCGEKEYKSIEKLPQVEDNDIKQEDTNKENVENPKIPNTNSYIATTAYSVFMLIVFACIIARVTPIRKRRYK